MNAGRTNDGAPGRTIARSVVCRTAGCGDTITLMVRPRRAITCVRRSLVVMGRRRSVLVGAGALAFVVLVAVALVSAPRTRTWDGLDAVLIPVFIAGVSAFAVCVLVVTIAFVRDRTLRVVVTFAVAAGVSGYVAVDAARRAFVDDTAPARHVVLPALLVAAAVGVLSLSASENP